MRSFFLLTLFVACLALPHLLNGQTCCSGGVPVSNEVGLPQGAKGSFIATLNHDYNRLRRLQNGRDKLENPFRYRNSNTYLGQIGYSFTDHLGVDALFSFISQERVVTSISGDMSDNVGSSGIADAVLLAKYQHSLDTLNLEKIVLSTGLKFPTGSSQEIADDGRFLTADLQPGSGTIDHVFLTRYTRVFPSKPSRKILFGATFIAKRTNEDYNNIDSYKFGNTTQLSLGAFDQFVAGKKLLGAGAAFRYRNVARDKFRHAETLNTGGSWLFIDPNMNFWVSKKLGITLKSNIPIISYVNEEQLTTNFRLNTGLIFLADKKERPGLYK